MTRRARATRWVVRLAVAAAMLLPPAAGAKTLGIIYPETCSFYDSATDSLRSYLGQRGWGEDRLKTFVQKPSADPMSWANALRKFDAVEANLIVVWGDSLLETACKEKLRAPVGYGFVFEPSLCACSRGSWNPGGSAAGVTSKTPLHTLLAKARLLAEYRSVAVLEPAGDRFTKALIEELRGIGAELGFTVSTHAVLPGADAVEALNKAPGDALLLLPTCSLITGQTEALIAAATERRMMTASLQPPRGSMAPLLALYPSPEEQGRLVGELAVQILEKGIGSAPAAPVAPKKIELELNLPLARQLGLKIPMALVESATRVIK